MNRRHIAREIGEIKLKLKKLIYIYIKKHSTDKKQTFIKDLGIEPLPFEQKSLNILQFWPSCQLTLNVYKADVSIKNFYQFFIFFNHFLIEKSS